MNCPKKIRQCPEGWTDCHLCSNKALCDTNSYVPEQKTDIEVVIEAAKISETVINAEVKKNVESIRGTWMEKFDQMSEEERMEEFMRYHLPDLHSKEPVPAGNGLPGGGSKSKVKKSRTGNKVYIDVWEGI